MVKTVSLDWKSFMAGEVVAKYPKESSVGVACLAIVPEVLMVSVSMSGSQDDTWRRILETALHIADYLDIAVIVFAGAVWMFNNRTKAIEMLLGGSIGYLIIRHAEDIQKWLAGL